MLLADENKIKIVQEGALPHIITLMRSPQDSVIIQATGCLRNLSVHRECHSKFSHFTMVVPNCQLENSSKRIQNSPRGRHQTTGESVALAELQGRGAGRRDSQESVGEWLVESCI